MGWKPYWFDMFQKNSLVNGLLAGLLVPIFGAALVYGLMTGLDALTPTMDIGVTPFFRERTSALVGIACNAIVLNRFYKLRFTDSMRGIVIVTFVYVVVWIILFRQVLFG